MSVKSRLAGGLIAVMALVVFAQGADSTKTSSAGLSGISSLNLSDTGKSSLNLGESGKSAPASEPTSMSAAGSSRGEMPVPEDIAKKVTNAVNVNPLGLVWGNINASYERFLPDRHGVMLQLGYYTKNGVSVAAHYRYHYYKEDQTVLNSWFVGGFVRYGNTNDEVEEDNGSVLPSVKEFTAQYLHVGANWGRRWILSNAMNIAARIGYGFPVWSQYKWTAPQPGTASSLENKDKYWNGVDAELSLGYTF
jgi:hypothetical protein